MATDTRQSEGYSILSRTADRTVRLTKQGLLVFSGFNADGWQLGQRVRAKCLAFEYKHDHELGVDALAHMLSLTLYGKRFFPYYAFCALGGLDEKGRGAVYSYDPVGSFERVEYQAGGSASALLQPFLDNQVGGKNLPRKPAMNVERAIKLAVDGFNSATERDIYTGDSIALYIITAQGVEHQSIPLRKD